MDTTALVSPHIFMACLIKQITHLYLLWLVKEKHGKFCGPCICLWASLKAYLWSNLHCSTLLFPSIVVYGCLSFKSQKVALVCNTVNGFLKFAILFSTKFHISVLFFMLSSRIWLHPYHLWKMLHLHLHIKNTVDMKLLHERVFKIL